jgi:hypothetical protein
VIYSLSYLSEWGALFQTPSQNLAKLAVLILRQNIDAYNFGGTYNEVLASSITPYRSICPRLSPPCSNVRMATIKPIEGRTVCRPSTRN